MPDHGGRSRLATSLLRAIWARTTWPIQAIERMASLRAGRRRRHVLEPSKTPQPAESPRNPSSRCQGSGPRVSLCRRDARTWGLRCERMLPPSPRWPGWSCEDATAGASSSGAAPEFPNHGAATCAWHDGRVVTGTRGPAGQASILLSLRRRNEAPRLHCAYRRGRCGPGPCLYAVPRPPTATPRLLSPGGDAPRPGPGTTGRPDGEETWSPTPQHRPDNCRRNGDPPLGREQTPRANGNLATGGRLWLPGGDPRRRRRDGP